MVRTCSKTFVSSLKSVHMFCDFVILLWSKSVRVIRKIVIVHLLGQKTSVKGIFVEKLSRLADGKEGKSLNLSELCRMTWDSDGGQKVCCEVAKRLQRVIVRLKGKPYPFVFCCQMGAKVSVIPRGPTWKEDIYLVPCRSPIPHRRHLKRTAQICQKNPDEVEELWRKLPQFGPKFVERAIESIEREQNVRIPEGIGETIRRTAKAYGLYEFDVVIYDTLRDILEKEEKHQGIVNIKFAARSRAKEAQIVRIVTDIIGAKDTQDEIPIVGLAAEENYSGRHEESLQSSRISELGRALLSDYVARFPEPHPQTEEEAGKWIAQTTIYLKNKLDEKDKWLKNVKEKIRLGLDCGSGTVCERLLRELAKAELVKTKLTKGDLSQFKDKLIKYADRLQGSLETDKRERVYVRTLVDLKEALESIDLDKNRKRTTHVIKELMKFLEPYPLTVSVLESRTGVNLLAGDLLSGNDDYRINIQERVYESNTSELRHGLLSTYVDLVAVVCKALTFGIAPSYPIIEHLRVKRYQKYSTKLYK